MFGLISNINYRCIQRNDMNSNDYKTVSNILFKIDSVEFMNIICSDANTFKHFFKIALQRFRFNSKMIKLQEDEKIKIKSLN